MPIAPESPAWSSYARARLEFKGLSLVPSIKFSSGKQMEPDMRFGLGTLMPGQLLA